MGEYSQTVEVDATANMVDDDGVLVAKFREGDADGGDYLADIFCGIWDVENARDLGGQKI